MNIQRENMRRFMQEEGGGGENATPHGYISSQKSSQSSSSTSSQSVVGVTKSSSSSISTSGLAQSKKINLSTSLNELARKGLADKSNKGGRGGLASSINKYNTTIKQLEVFVDKSSSSTVKIESSSTTTAYKDTLLASSSSSSFNHITNRKASIQQQPSIKKPTLTTNAAVATATAAATEGFFSENNSNMTNQKDVQEDEVEIVPVLPIVVPKHLRHLYTTNRNMTPSISRKRFLSSTDNNDQENRDPAAVVLHEKKLKSNNNSPTIVSSKELFVSNAPALDFTLTKETESYDKQQELKARQAMLQTTDNLKSHQWNDPMMVAEYAGEIFGYLYDSEPTTMANPTYAYNCQHEVTWKMRSVLIDWVIEIHYLFQLLPETLFLAVNIIDRFLSERTVVLGKLQLVGITSLFIATKFEEMSCPTMQDFLFMTDHAVKEEELIKAERFILQVLDFHLCYPNPMNFLRRICTDELKCDVHTRTLTKYFMEISCIDHEFIGIRPSKIAAAALWLSKKMLAKGKWNHHYSKVCGYTPDELKPVVESMLDYLSQPVTHDAFFKKWSSTKMSKASVFVRDWINRYYIN